MIANYGDTGWSGSSTTRKRLRRIVLFVIGITGLLVVVWPTGQKHSSMEFRGEGNRAGNSQYMAQAFRGNGREWALDWSYSCTGNGAVQGRTLRFKLQIVDARTGHRIRAVKQSGNVRSGVVQLTGGRVAISVLAARRCRWSIRVPSVYVPNS